MQKMNDRTPNFRHLRVFAEVARRGSISMAADRIHLSQPAISQALAKLEENFGVKLFERRSDGMTPTEHGLLALARVERALELVEGGAREAARLSVRKGARAFANFEQLLTTPQLRALAAVSGARNFSLAARDAGVAQPTLHRAARDLERLSGIPLFIKSAAGIDLTASAKALAQAVKLAFAELNQAFDEIDAALGLAQGEIVIGAMPLPRTHLLPAAINALTRERPEVRLRVVEGPYNDLLHGLRHGDIDLLVGALRHPPPIDDITQETLFVDPLAVVGRAGHPLAEKPAVSVEELASYPWAAPRDGTPTRDYFNKMFNGLTITGGLVETSSLVLIRGMLLGSDRLTLISAHQISHERDIGLLVPLAVDTSGGSRPIGITCRRDWKPTPVQQLFLDHLRAAGKLAERG